MKKLSISGETIVEVLIGIAVVGGTLSGAYYLLNRSYKQSQASIERVAAIKAAESRVEVLRTLSSATLAANSINPFCLSSTGTLHSATEPQCIIDGKYTVTITKNSPTYSVKAEWNGLLIPKESVTIYYRP